MATDATAPPLSATPAASGRLESPAVAREALERYPWPLLNRVAGYITICAAVFSTIFTENLSDLPRVVASVVLGTTFVVAYHLLSGCLAQMATYKRVGLVVIQVVCAVILFQLITTNDTGPLVLLFAVACEFQFLVPLRVALAGALGLWLLALVTIELLRVNAHAYVIQHHQILTDGASTMTGLVF